MRESLNRRAAGLLSRNGKDKQLRELCPVPNGKLIWAEGVKLEPEWCRPLNDPVWTSATDAVHMRPDDVVLGVANNDGAWAFPWWIMKNHHVANVVLGGAPRAIVFCEACATAGLYDPMIGNVRFRWAVAGVADGMTFVRDDQNGSLWNPLNMTVIHGHHMESPRRLPLVQARWDEWTDAHPESTVVTDDESVRTGHGRLRTAPDHRVRGFSGTKPNADDHRVDPLSLVLGVIGTDGQAAYPLDRLDDAGGIIYDSIGTTDVVVTRRPGTWTVSAFERDLEGSAVNLAWEGHSLVDANRGGRWSALGVSHAASTLSSLTYVPSGLEKWHAWQTVYPDAPLYGH